MQHLKAFGPGRIFVLLASAALLCAGAEAVKSTTKPPAKKASTKASSKSKPKRYMASAGRPGSTAPKKSAAPKPAGKPVAPKRRPVKITPVNPKFRAQAHDAVFENVAGGAELPIENAGALVPFFEQLYRNQTGELPGPLRILHYGDSHTAADEWTGELRARFQEKFGSGGSGYSFIGRPWNGYRRLDVRSGSTRGWHTDGLVGRSGDGVYGLGGVSMSAHGSHEGVFLEADGAEFELFYYQQPGGGTLEITDNGVPLERLATDGPAGPAYYHITTDPGPHRVELETLDAAPVRLFGWVAENASGVTY